MARLRLPGRRGKILACTAVGLAIPLALLAFAGCVSTVTPPENPAEPTPVYLLWDARHRGLALPSESGSFVVWGYGDWDWYAQNRDAWYQVFDTVLWPTQGALGRRVVPGGDEAILRRSLGGARLAEIVVPRAGVQDLLDRLEEEFAAGGEPHANLRYGAAFVRHDDGFWILHNCNDAVAAWLRVLGCEISWVPIRLDLQLSS